MPEDALALCDNCPPERMVKGLNEMTLAGVLERAAEADAARYRFREEPLPTYLWMRIARDEAHGASVKSSTRSAAS